jgi:hypothetical protein
MNRFGKIFKWVSISIGSAIGIAIGLVVVVVVLIGLWFIAIPNILAKHHIQQAYAKIQFPSYVHFLGKGWTSGSVDVAASWQYNYSFNESETAVYNDVMADLASYGFKDVGNNPPSNFTVNDDADNLTLSGNLSPGSLSIDAQEAN